MAEPRLTPADCKAKAEDCRAMAKKAHDPTHKTMLEHMAETWERIAADVAARNVH